MSRVIPEHLYSGLETEGMKMLKCTLKLQPYWAYDPRILTLKGRRVVVRMDDGPSKTVNFRGCKVIQLKVESGSDREHGIMPIVFTIAGPCYYTKEDKRDFEIMMRTKKDSLLMKLPPNGEFDWPTYRAFETCPLCLSRAKPGSEDRYWLLIHTLMQATPDRLGIRFVCRLTCEECFESITDEQYMSVSVGPGNFCQEVPLLDVVEEQGPITWLKDGPMSVRVGPGGSKILNAYTLYSAWEHSGTWEALSNNFAEEFQQCASESSFGDRLSYHATKQRDPSEYWEMDQIPVKKGRKCDGPGCTNVHGNRKAPKPGKVKGKKIYLGECTGCFDTMYCSKECQNAAWSDHKVSCKEAQRKRKQDEDKKKAEAKDAVLASFVPLSITPQGGTGSTKKKGKKGGCKKKKGKK